MIRCSCRQRCSCRRTGGRSRRGGCPRWWCGWTRSSTQCPEQSMNNIMVIDLFRSRLDKYFLSNLRLSWCTRYDLKDGKKDYCVIGVLVRAMKGHVWIHSHFVEMSLRLLVPSFMPKMVHTQYIPVPWRQRRGWWRRPTRRACGRTGRARRTRSCRGKRLKWRHIFLISEKETNSVLSVTWRSFFPSLYHAKTTTCTNTIQKTQEVSRYSMQDTVDISWYIMGLCSQHTMPWEGERNDTTFKIKGSWLRRASPTLISSYSSKILFIL